MNKELIKRGAKIELARREFFYYCNLKAPDFYRPERTHLVTLCNELQSFLESDEKVFIGNLPPRHGKSRTGGCLVEWIFGKDKTKKVMAGSYNETLSTTFSKGVRNTIQEIKGDEKSVVYRDVFPDTSIQYGDGAMNLWSLEGGYNNYLATSPTGTSTGFGADIFIVDDLIKSSYEAYNAEALEKQWEWLSNTVTTRLEEGGKLIILMTRWHSKDVAGRAIEWCRESNIKHRLLSLKAYENGKMLCPDLLSYESYMDKLSIMGEDIASANYQQEPIDRKGRLYTSLKTYDQIPTDQNGNPLFTEIKNYTDTADEGSDYLCSITYGVYNGEAYVLDVIYTKKPMEETEPMVARMLYDQKANSADIESNNGGRGFSRSVQRILSEMGTNRTVVSWFHQSQNKKARILSNSTWVMNHIYFPTNWKDRWREYYTAMTTYQKEGKNAHDDAPDATTGIAEKINKHNGLNKGFRGGI